MVFFGILGLLILSAAWIYETYENFKKRKNLIDLKFAYAYLAGIVMMLIYSMQINDTIKFEQFENKEFKPYKT